MTRLNPSKVTEVEQLSKLIKENTTIALAPISGLPALQFQEVRAKLRGKATIKVTKMTLFKRALDSVGDKQIIELEDHIEGPLAVIFTDMNPFKLFAFLKKNKSKAAAKAGQVASEDIIIPAGDTGLPPGPALGDLKTAGINARIDGGSIKVMKDSVVTKKGEVVSFEVAGALGKLGIKPMEVGMLLSAAYENGMIYTDTVLNIDEEATLASLQNGFRSAFNLAFNTFYFNSKTIEPLLQKGFADARNLGINALVLDTGVVEDLVVKAQQSAFVRHRDKR
jgi:large subunit ribosomal protein L10